MKRAIAAVLVLWSSVALAEPAGAQAAVLLRRGRDLLAAGRVAEACGAFEDSQTLEPATTTLLALAGCRERLGQLATAWGILLDAARRTRSAAGAASRQLHDVAQARARALAPRVSRLTINVPQRSQVDGLEISRGEDRVDAGLWNRALPVDGGTYTITARAPGANAWSTQVTIAAQRDITTVEIPDLRNLPGDLAAPAAVTDAMPLRPPSMVIPIAVPAVVPAIDRAPGSPRTGHGAPLVLGVGALALLGGGLGLELRAEARYDAAKSEMMSHSRRVALYDSANTNRYVAEALAATGLFAGAAEVWLCVRDAGHRPDAAIRARVRVAPTATGLAVSGRF